MPKVSVIIPNYNHGHFLEQRLNSIFSQTYQDFEIIFLDDASTDNSKEIFSQFAINPCVKAIFNQTNSGSPFKQWNKGIKHAVGEYIWIAESDDYADPCFLEELVGILDQYPSVGLVYCQSYQVDSSGKKLNPNYLFWTNDINKDRWNTNFFNSGISECCNYLVCKNTIPNASAVLFRKNTYLKISKKNELFTVTGDWLTYVELLSYSDIFFVSSVLNYFRCHDNNSSRNTARLGLIVKESLEVVKQIGSINKVKFKPKQMSFRNLYGWWLTHLFNNHWSWKSEKKTFFTFLSIYNHPILWMEAFGQLVYFPILLLRIRLKLGTKLKKCLGYAR